LLPPSARLQRAAEFFWAVDEVSDFRALAPEPAGVLRGNFEAAEERFDIEWEVRAPRDVDGWHGLEEPGSAGAFLDGRLRDLASSLAAGVGDVRGCLILSKDGLVLGSHPDSGEVEAKHAWARFAALGDLERGFVRFGAETWCFVRLGPYEAFAIIGPGGRPGLVIDHLEQVLLAAEETRSKHPSVREPAAGSPHTTKPRIQLHPESRPAGEPVAITSDIAPPVVASVANAAPMAAKVGSAAPAGATRESWTSDETTLASASSGSPDDHAEVSGRRVGGGEGPEHGTWGRHAQRDDGVDLFSLASEFGQLLDDETGADG